MELLRERWSESTRNGRQTRAERTLKNFVRFETTLTSKQAVSKEELKG